MNIVGSCHTASTSIRLQPRRVIISSVSERRLSPPVIDTPRELKPCPPLMHRLADDAETQPRHAETSYPNGPGLSAGLFDAGMLY
jgi:hypothetical protein